jgi:hypothetical protein
MSEGVPGPPHRGVLPLGSWRIDVRATHARYLETLGALFRQPVATRPAWPPGAADVRLALLDRPAGTGPFRPASSPPEGSTPDWRPRGPGRRELHTGGLALRVDARGRPLRVSILVREPQVSPRGFRDRLLELLVRLLFTFDRLYLHAAAVRFAGRVHLFVGEGGFGKTSVALRLGQAGGTVLSEDHVLLRRTRAGFRVSGCQETVRVTAATEAALFGAGGPLRGVAPQADGKKEVPLAALVPAEPYRDRPVHRILFNRVGRELRLRPLTRPDALRRLVHMTRGFFRPSGAADLRRHLALLSALTAGPALHELELSPDLRRLDDLVELLRR